MNTEQLRQNAAAMLAFADGKPIEVKHVSQSDNVWGPCQQPTFECEKWNYRPKQEPKARPWSLETIPEMPIGVRNKSNGCKRAIVSANTDALWIAGRDAALTYQELMEQYSLPNGDICGEIV